MDRTEIETLVARFIKQSRGARVWSDAEECVGLCDEASEALAYWCERQGVESEITHEQRTTSGRSASHTVLTVGGWTVDLTARQYDETAEFPSIY
jgi:hypothetical protein